MFQRLGPTLPEIVVPLYIGHTIRITPTATTASTSWRGTPTRVKSQNRYFPGP